MAKLVSGTYGDALFEEALEVGLLRETFDQVQVLLDCLNENPELEKLMVHPRISGEEKVKIIEETFGGRFLPEIVGLLRMLAEKDRFKETRAVCLYFIGRVREYEGIGVAYVTSAADLKEGQKKAVEKRLLETTRYKTFEMHYTTDPSLIGGLKIRIGDRVVDSSIRNKLDHLTRDLSKIQINQKAGECAL